MSIPKQHRDHRANGLSRRHGGKIGLTRYLAGLLSLAAFNAFSQNETLNLAWQASATATVAGYNFYYGETSRDYNSVMNVGTNLTATVTGLRQGVTYYFTTTSYLSNGQLSVFSNEVTNRIPILPTISRQPFAQTVVAGRPVVLAVSAFGDAPLSFQWFNGSAPMAGATTSSLSWPQIGMGSEGSYWVSVSNPAGSVTSSIATVTVVASPSILTQPQSQTVIATTAASLSCAATGSAPLFFQWSCGTIAIAGATTSALAWASVAASNAGNYYLTVSNAAGAVASSFATLKVLPTNTIATVAGAYNGLFFQTNANGTPNMTEGTAGFLGNCIVAGNGAYSAKIYLNGSSCSLAGVFNVAGSASATISLPGAGLSNLTVNLQLDLFNGSQQLSGSVASTATGNVWTAPLLGELATNALPTLTGASLLLSPGPSTNSPTNSGAGSGLVLNGVLSLAGTLGDTAAFSQTVPISAGGNVPLYVNLYNNGGLLAGWINLAGSAPVGNLTWIRPAGVLVPAGFPQGFDTVVQVGGATYSGTALVTGQTLGGWRNNFTGPVGFQFVCASNCTCRAVGRGVFPGNTQPHVVALCSASGAVLACATVTTAGATAGYYAYASLATPYAMTAGTTYYIFSAEVAGGDEFFSGSITTTTSATNVNASSGSGALPGNISGLNNGGGWGQSAGPVNLQYTIP